MRLQKPAFFLLAFLLFITPVMAQQGDANLLPETTAGQRVAAYLKTFNSGDEQLMRAFFAEHVAARALQRRSVEERVGIYRQMRANMETMTLRRVLEARADFVSVLIETKKGAQFEIGFQFEQDAPHKLIGLRVEEIDSPQQGSSQPKQETPETPLTEAEALALIEKRLNELIAADEISGVVMITKGKAPLLQKAFGLASREYNVANRMDTKFNLGSINKIFTQIAVGQLVEQGKLSFDDKLGKHLPDYPNRDAAAKVTIRQLLDMASGIGDFFGPEFQDTPKDRLRSIKDFLPLFASKPLLFEPGTRQRYSNGGYIVLGAIIEKVSGQDYYEYVREHIFKPAGMQNSDWYEADIPTPNLATGYTREGTEGKSARRTNIYMQPAKGSPAGGGYSTAEDLLKFATALQTGKLRLPDFKTAASATVGNQNSHTGKPAPFPGIGVAGGAPGINAFLVAAGAESSGAYTIILMSNYDPPSAENLGKQIRGWLKRVKK
jgi:CubicO group peptidase (beta-lactamase class C family)